MIVTKTYLSKCNTIVKDNPANLSLNPVLELNYGKMLSRGLIYFDHINLKKMVEDKVYPDISKLRHTLKMTNCSSITDKHINKPCLSFDFHTHKDRAVSFDVILFLLPNQWDNGRGFDFVYDYFHDETYRGVSTDASNWYQFSNYKKWNNEGIYDIDFLFTEYDKFTSKNGNLSDVIIAKQHFDYGNENLEIDITEIVNQYIEGKLENYGFGMAFAPYYENLQTKRSQYVGFFTQHTHSFFKPYVETTYNEFIEDDRNNFYLDKDNKLYFYASVGGFPVNLDELPVCTINGSEIVSKQATKGVYYTEVNFSSSEYESNAMYSDVWSNIKYKNKQFPDVELSFVTKETEGYFSFGLPNNSENTSHCEYVTSVYGINDSETVNQGDIRKVNVDCKIPYTSSQVYPVDGLYYRLYVHSGTDQIDVIDWTPVERGYNENYFLINTNDLIPERYYVDLKICHDKELTINHKALQFDIVNNITDKKN